MKTIYEYNHLPEDEHYFKGHKRSYKACFPKFSSIFIYQPILRTFLLNTYMMKMHIFHKMKYDLGSILCYGEVVWLSYFQVFS